MEQRGLAAGLGLLLAFCALAQGGHDHWAATVVHCAALVLAGACLLRSYARRLPGLSASFLVPLGLWACALGLSFRGAVNPAESFLRLEDCLAAMLLFWTALNVLRETAAAEAFLAVLVPLAWVEALVILHQRWTCGEVFAQVPGTLVNANAAAAFSLLWLPPLLERARLAWSPGSGRRWFWTSGAAACGAALLLLSSSWALLVLAAGLPAIMGPEALRRWAGRRPRWAAAAALLAACAGAGLALWKLGDPLEGRPAWWLSGLLMLADHPVAGVGLGNYPSAYLAYKAGAALHTLSPHSVPILIASETGLVGLGAALLFLASWALVLRRGWSVVKPRWPYALGAALLLVYGCASLSVEYLANLVGLSLALAAAVAPAARSGARPRLSVVLVLSAAGIAAVPHILAPWQADRSCVAGRAELEAGDLAAADHAFSAAAELDPRSWEARQGLAAVAWARARAGQDPGGYERAVLEAGRAAALSRLSGALRWELGFFLEAAGRGDEALGAYGEAVRLHDASPRALRDLERLRVARPWKGRGA